MAGTRAAIRYAKAVLSLASDQDSASLVDKDMKLIANAIAENDDLNRLLKSAVIKSDIKKDILNKLFPKLNDLSTKLFDLLVTNKRIDILGDVALKYSLLFDELSGKEKAFVTTALPMDKSLESKVLKKIKELTSKTIELENIVDDSIIGGFILRIGDQQYNASVANNLNKLKKEFTLS